MWIDPSQIPWILKAMTGGIGFVVAAALVYRLIDPDWRQTLAAIIDSIVPDSEPRRWDK